MPKSSRHKSHKQSKHSSRDYSDSEEDVVKVKEKEKEKEKRSRDSASGDKRKTSSLLRDGKDNQAPSGHGNGDTLGEYLSSKRRKEKTDVGVGGDRWNGDGEERMDSERHVEKESHKGGSLNVDVKLKSSNNKAESLRVESKGKSKRHDSGIAGERKEDSLVPVVAAKEENKTKGESRRKSERGSSRKEGKESKDKDRRSEKEKNGGQDTKSGDAEVKSLDVDVGKKQGTQLLDLSAERQSRKYRENNERASLDELKNPGLDKDIDKKVRKKVEGSNEREKYYDESKESDGRRVSSKCDHTKDSKHRDDKHRDGGYPDEYQEDSRKDGRRRDDKYWEEDDRDNKHHDKKYREDGERDSRRRDDRHRGDGDRDGRHKDEKQRDDGEWDCRRKNDKYHEVIERDEKYHEESDKDYRHKDDRSHEEVDKDLRRGDGKYYEDGDRDDRRRDDSYRDDCDRDYRHKDEKYCEDMERDVRYKDSKQGDGYDRKKRPRDSKYRVEQALRDRTGDKSDSKRSRDDGYAPDHHVRKSSAHDDSPTHDDRATRYRDDQGRRRNTEKEDYSDVKSRGSNDQRSDAEKKSAGSRRMDPVTDRVRSTSRNVDMELTPGHSRRRSSPTSGSHAPRDNYRAAKQDDSKFRDYNYEDRSRQNMNSTRDYSGFVGGSDKNSTSMKVQEKSPSSSFDRRQLTRPETRRNIDFDESTQRGGGSRDWKDVHPAEELVPANADTISVSSPSAKNSHLFSSNSKSFPPPTPSLLGSGDGEGRSGKPNMRNRRMGDHNMGRMQVNQNNAWRDVPSWPSPAPNGFLPFPPASPFHSVMQPFHAPPMFGVGPSMELNHHHSPYHIYGRPEWDHTRNMSGGGGWETSKDLSKGPNRNVSLEIMPSSEKENDEDVLGGQSVQTPQNEKTRVDQQSESDSDVMQSRKSFGNNEIGVIVSSGDGGDVDKVSMKDDIPFCHFYLSKLDISVELAESELYDKCPGLIDTDEIMCSGADDSKILFMEGLEDKIAPPISLFASTDGSVFEKSISLYNIQKEIFLAETGVKPKAIPNSNQEDTKVQEDITEKLCTGEATHGMEDTTKTLQENINGFPSNVTTENPKEPITTQSLDTEYGPLLNSDVSSEAMKPEWVNLSRIHESTH